MSFNIADFQSKGEDAERPATEIRNPASNEDYHVLDQMCAENVNVSRLGTGMEYFVGPLQLRLIHPKDRRKMNLQVFGLRRGYILSIYDPSRSKLGDAIEAAKDKWSKHEFVHKDRAYHVSDAEEQGDSPQPPFDSLSELIQDEFEDRIVDRDDHPVLLEYLKKLQRGQ